MRNDRPLRLHYLNQVIRTTMRCRTESGQAFAGHSGRWCPHQGSGHRAFCRSVRRASGAQAVRERARSCIATVHVAGGSARDLCRSSCHPPPVWAKPHRLSTPVARPSGVRIRPKGALPRSAPVSAARCKRRTGVSAGGPGRSATTRGTAPDLSVSSAHQSRSSARCGVTRISRPGSTKPAMPSPFSRSVSHRGEIQITSPQQALATIRASVRRAAPQISCTRPGASASCPKNRISSRGPS